MMLVYDMARKGSIFMLRAATAGLALAIAMIASLTASQPAYGSSFKVLYAFPGGASGATPGGKLILDSSGNLYGTTQYTKAEGFGFGTVYKLTRNGKETVLHEFTGQSDGAWPAGGLVFDSAGNLYGTATEGGNSGCGGNGCGVVFELDPKGRETVLYQFQGGNDGGDPNGDLARDLNGNLYGTAYWGPYGFGGVAFKVNSKGEETVLHDFVGMPDGEFPGAGVYRDAPGNIWGTTIQGGGGPCLGGCGAVFKIAKSGKEGIVYRFLESPDGASPIAGVIADGSGNLYGTTFGGGDPSCQEGPGCGTVYEITSAGREKILYRFHQSRKESYPVGGLIRDDSGNLYGTTWGSDEGSLHGTVFKLDPQGKETILHLFSGTDGCNPTASLTFDSAGNLYGTASGCGTDGNGVVFEITP
jgi:uncharacterized repeat protein (TIGR03803 family)